MPETLALLGDVMLGRGTSVEILRRPAKSFWGTVLPILRRCDAVVANLECAITTHTDPWARTPKAFHFGAVPAAIKTLRAANIRCVSLANNHILDFETCGLLDTIDHLDRAGIAHAGAGATLADAMRPAVFDVGSTRVGLISLTDNEPSFGAGLDHPGTYYVRIRSDPAVVAPIAEAVRSLRMRTTRSAPASTRPRTT